MSTNIIYNHVPIGRGDFIIFESGKDLTLEVYFLVDG